MGTRYSTVVRLLGLALLVLVVSPVTAPFSTVDVIGLLNGSPAAGTSLNSKKVADEPASELSGEPSFVSTALTSEPVPLFDEGAGGSRLLLDTPLRV